MARDREKWQSIQLILSEATPADEADTASWLKPLPYVQEGFDGFREEHHPEARERCVEMARIEGKRLSVAAHKGDISKLITRTSDINSSLENLNTDNAASWSNRCRYRKRGRSNAAAEIKHSFAVL
jgi:hypothetical protein